jgi:hypothetical protein
VRKESGTTQVWWISFNQRLNSRAHVRTLELERGFLKNWQAKQETMGARKEDVFSEEQQLHFLWISLPHPFVEFQKLFKIKHGIQLKLSCPTPYLFTKLNAPIKFALWCLYAVTPA